MGKNLTKKHANSSSQERPMPSQSSSKTLAEAGLESQGEAEVALSPGRYVESKQKLRDKIQQLRSMGYRRQPSSDS